MEIVKTSSSELAIYQKGNLEADRLLLCLPGRLDTKDYPHMRSHVDYFAARGYLAVSFDPPGTWESPGEMDIYTMTNYLTAIAELIEHYGNKPTVLLGHSRGGTTAMTFAVQHEIVTHVIAVMSNTSPSQKGEGEQEADYEISMRDPIPGATKPIEFKLPFAYFTDAKQYNPLEALKTYPKPKLFIKGTQDTVIDPNEIDRAYELAAEPKEYVVVAGEHDYRKQPEVIADVNKRVAAFLEKYN